MKHENTLLIDILQGHSMHSCKICVVLWMAALCNALAQLVCFQLKMGQSANFTDMAQGSYLSASALRSCMVAKPGSLGVAGVGYGKPEKV